jgi:hypothetical protein
MVDRGRALFHPSPHDDQDGRDMAGFIRDSTLGEGVRVSQSNGSANYLVACDFAQRKKKRTRIFLTFHSKTQQ